MNLLYQLAIFVSITLLTTPVAYADGCRVVGVRSYSPSYTSNYQSTYSYTPTLAVPVEVRTFFQVAPELAQLKINQAMADEAAEKAAEKATQKMMNKLLEEQRKQQAPERSTPTPPPSNEPGDPLADKPLTYANAPDDDHAPHSTVKTILAAHCTACHGSGSKWDLTAPEKLSATQWDKLADAVNHEHGVLAMPKGKPKLPLEERKKLQAAAFTMASGRLQ